jgi:hypothetical protein
MGQLCKVSMWLIYYALIEPLVFLNAPLPRATPSCTPSVQLLKRVLFGTILTFVRLS